MGFLCLRLKVQFEFGIYLPILVSKDIWNNQLFLSGYFGRDVFGTSFGFNWGNGTISSRWNHVFSEKLFMNATAFYSNYDYLLDSDIENKRPNDSFKWSSNIENLSIKPDFTYYVNPTNTVSFGGQILSYEFKPGKAIATSTGEKREFGQANKKGTESSAYISQELKISPVFSVQYGMRYSYYDYKSLNGEYYDRVKVPISTENASGYILKINKTDPTTTVASYGNWEPRLSLNLNVGQNASLKTSYNRLAQYVHLMSNTAASTPLDVWTSSTNNIKPQLADQVAMGFFKNLGPDGNNYETSVEVYYKAMQNQIDYADRANLFLNPYFEKDLLFGDGRAYGIEFFFKKSVGRFTGWVGYTWAKTERRFPDINEGNIYPAKYDRRHDLTLVGTYKLNDRWTFSASFIYATGNTLTLPSSWYVQEQNLLFNYGPRNSTRMAPYHRLDLSATLYSKAYKTKTDPATGKEIEVKKRYRSNWSFSIYNVYNRMNPFFLYVDNDGDFLSGNFKLSVKQVSLFPIIPSATWNFEF